jgi:hypothetical protein
MPTTIVAIDPDVDKNGIAILDKAQRTIAVRSLTFPPTLELLHSLQGRSDVLVCIEAGWLIHHNWHVDTAANNRYITAAIGNSAGRNHEVGRKLAEMCEYWQLTYKLQQPLKKCWRGKDRKITAAELTQVLQRYKLKAEFKRTGQDVRDACLLAIAQM